MATLLLTRPHERSRIFLAECEEVVGHSLQAVVSPVFEVEATGLKPNFEHYKTLIFTSSNAVRQVDDSLAGRRVVTVGERTAALACAAGAEANALGHDLAAFVENADQIGSPALYCRGVHTHGNLADTLRNRGVTTDEAVLYDQVARPLSIEAKSVLLGSEPVVAPLFSVRSVKLLSENQISAKLTIVAISLAVAEAWSGPGAIHVADTPDSVTMAKLVGAYI